MSRKNIIIIVIVLVVIMAAGIAVSYFLSFKKVTFTVQKPGISADIYKTTATPEEGSKNTDQKVASISGTQTLSLQTGSYYATPTTKNYDPAQITFNVSSSDVSVTVNPDYSADYLASQLPNELAAIKSALLAKYPQLNNYILNDGKLYTDSTWYGTTAAQKPDRGNNGDVYRTVLHKVNNTWQIVATPQIVLTASENKDIPAVILRDLNKQTGY